MTPGVVKARSLIPRETLAVFISMSADRWDPRERSLGKKRPTGFGLCAVTLREL